MIRKNILDDLTLTGVADEMPVDKGSATGKLEEPYRCNAFSLSDRNWLGEELTAMLVLAGTFRMSSGMPRTQAMATATTYE